MIRVRLLGPVLAAMVICACGSANNSSQGQTKRSEFGCLSGTVTGSIVGGLTGRRFGGGTGRVIETGVGSAAGRFSGSRLTCG